MKCKICGEELLSSICSRCEYEHYELNLSKPTKIEKDDNILKVDDFFKFFYNLKSLNTYINRKYYLPTKILYKDTFAFLKSLKVAEALFKYARDNYYSIKNLNRFISLYEHLEEEVDKLNDKFIEEKLMTEKEYLDKILIDVDPNINLDDEQRRAILTDEDYCLIIAGAGAGKTTTMAAKVKYLIDKLGVNEKDILVVSYTNKAVEELREKIEALKINPIVETFHKIGNTIIAKENQIRSKVLEDKKRYKLIQNFLKNEVLKDFDLLKRLILFFGCYLNIPPEVFNFNSIEEYFAYIERIDYSTLKSNLLEYNIEVINQKTKKLISINNEYLKSIQEVQIANYLYLHNIDYEYEKVYKYKLAGMNRRYTPDFYIKQGDKEIYIEHFGISENGKNSRYNENERKLYLKRIEDKKLLHKKYNTTLICTYSSYNDGRDLITHLEEELKKHGIVLGKKDEKEVFSKIVMLENDKYFFKFAFLARRFLSLFKVNGYTEKDFNLFKAKAKSPRTILFLEIMERIYLYYQDYLRKHNEIDFEDMINEAYNILSSKEHLRYNFKYIIVDEYQDISRQRFNLAKIISDVTGAKVVAVGDDWQSIYAFAGSDITLFTSFLKVFEYGKELKITRTYRNAQEVIDIAGGFIQKNSKQIRKALTSIKHINSPVIIYTYQVNKENRRKTDAKAKIVSDIVGTILEGKSNPSTHKILFIGRYGFDAERLSNSGYFKYNPETNKVISTQYPDANITFLTAHSAKGLGFDDVVIINAEHSTYGFPSQIEDDPILKLVTINDDSDKMKYSEERRLFYVALTRTKNRIYIVAPEENPSSFVIEILNDYNNVVLKGNINRDINSYKKARNTCPRCGYPVQLRVDKNFGMRTYVCMNDIEVCDFVTNDLNGDERGIHFCDKCDGYMIVRRNKNYEYFYGCTNYISKEEGCQNAYNVGDYIKRDK